MEKRKDRTIVAHNDFRNAPMGKLSAVGHNLMWTAMYLIKDKNIEELKAHGRTEIDIPTETFLRLSNYQRGRVELHKEFAKVSKALQEIRIPYKNEEEDKEGFLVPFPLITHSADYSVTHVLVLKEFAYIVDFIFRQGNYTKVLLTEITELNSKYAKTAYYHMSTYRDTGVWSLDIDKFKEIMAIGDSYKPKDIRRQIIDPIGIECSQYFKNLTYYEKRGAKKTIERIMFKFDSSETSVQGEVKRQSQLKQLKEGEWIKKSFEVLPF